jgi:hypothetical protein
MTKDQVREEMDRILPEYFDGYILIARLAGQGKFIVSEHITDEPTKSGITLVMADAINELSGPAPGLN